MSRLTSLPKNLIDTAGGQPLCSSFPSSRGLAYLLEDAGDAGLPPEFTFTLSPSELKASAPLFPLPERTVTSGLITFGYGGETLFPFNVELPRGASGRAQIALHVEYLACKDMCVPESADVKFSIQLTSKEKIQMTQRPLLLLYAPS